MTSNSTGSLTPHFPKWTFVFVLIVALLARVFLLGSGTVSFHSDEAIVGLMARHILQGERPTFFYGQPYMGSLDAWVIALGFRLLGDSLMTMRIVESVLYLLVVASGFLVAWRFSGRTLIAGTAGLVLAVPPVNSALYTTATLGGYNETLLLGSWMLLAYDVTGEHPHSWLRWALLGLCAGVGWWTNGLIMVYAAPVALVILYTRIRGHTLLRALPFFALALTAFFIGSAPWWVFDFSHNHAALGMYLSSRQTGEFAGIGIPYVPPLQRALGLVVIGLPALIGMRFPWSSDYFAALLGIPIIFLYGIALYRLLRHYCPLKGSARALTVGMLGLFCLLFVASTFGADPTGRYFVPLVLPLGILLGTLVAGLRSERDSRKPESNAESSPPLYFIERGSGGEDIITKSFQKWSLRVVLPFVLIVLVVGYQAAAEIAAASTPPGFTTQFDPVSHIPNDHDAELVAFLESNHLLNGYTNYWVAFRMAFLSGERLQYRSALPYKSNMSYNQADDRYQPYRDATDQAERVAYITTNLPELDSLLQAAFAEQKLTYQQAQIGLFHIYYDFQPGKPSHEKVKARFPQTGF